MIKTLHLIGSKGLGGAENWFFRCTKALKEYGLEVYTGIRAGSEVEDIVREDSSSFSLPFYTVWDPISRFSISRVINKLRPQIVQTYMSRATRLTKISPKKSIHIARLGGYYGLRPFAHAHAWIGNTKGICDYLIQNGFPPKRVFHITNFIDIPRPVKREEKIGLLKKLSISKDHIIILTPARFVPVKGHETLFKSIYLLTKDREVDKRFRLILLGNGPLKDKLFSLAKSLGIMDLLIWPGWQVDVRPYYEVADIIAFPSMENETLGNVILEAWSYKLPVVCTRFRGAREITKDMEDVVSADCRDAKGLYMALKKVLEDEELRSYISKNGYKKVLKYYTKDKIIKKYIEVYNYLLNNG